MVDKQIAHEIPVYRGIFYGGIMVTKILLAIMLVLYIALLITRYKKKGNPKIEGGVQVVQGILWSFIAVDSWAERSIGMRIVYIIIILMSFIAGIKEFYRCRQ